MHSLLLFQFKCFVLLVGVAYDELEGEGIAYKIEYRLICVTRLIVDKARGWIMDLANQMLALRGQTTIRNVEVTRSPTKVFNGKLPCFEMKDCYQLIGSIPQR